MKTPLTLEQLGNNFSDLHPAYRQNEALVEAARCLFCFDAPCTRACPTHIDVPRFIRQILHDNPAGAAKTILSENILGGSCARACPTEVLCEGACVDRTLGGPVQIGRLQRYATDYAMNGDLRFFQPGRETGKTVAIVGSGPAGLSCAHELRKMGHAVTLFEARDVAGGLNTLGIAAYKITTEFALSEVELVRQMGAHIRLNSPVDAAKLARLRASYDAVFLGIGLGATAKLNLPGEGAADVWEALDFIFQTHTQPLSECHVGQNVIVIGAGNTAIDVATEAVRLGAANATIAYRRSQEEMSAFAYEYELAQNDGVRFEWSVQPVEFVLRDGKLTAIEFQRTRLGSSGRPANVELVAGSEFTMVCDMAVKALGQMALLELLAGVNGVRFEKGKLVVDPETGSTGASGLFAGGDCISLGAEIVNAVQEGKIAARGIDQYLRRGIVTGSE